MQQDLLCEVQSFCFTLEHSHGRSVCSMGNYCITSINARRSALACVLSKMHQEPSEVFQTNST